MSEFISNHIIIWGYAKGWNQFIESIREESNIPIVIISETSKRAEIINATRLYPNVIYFKGNPLKIEHLKNANINESSCVIIPSKTDETLIENDCNAAMIANIIKQNWPNAKVSVEFNSNSKAWLIENLLSFKNEQSDDSYTSIYTNKGYMNGKIFSSVLLSRMSAVKSLRKESYETISSLLKYVLNESNIITLEIPNKLKLQENLTYGNVRDYLLFNSKTSLMSLGVYIPDEEAIQRINYQSSNFISKSDDDSDIKRQSIALGKFLNIFNKDFK